MGGDLKKFLPALVCGFGASVITTVPGLRDLGCCLVVPLAAMFSIILYKRTDNSILKIEAVTAVGFGFATGIIAAFFASCFDVLITFITRSNEFVSSLPQTESMIKGMKLGPVVDESLKLLKKIASEITKTGFSPLYTVFIFITNMITFSIFGILGGLIGMLFVNKKT
jgi:hypothetical protein